VSTPKRQYWTIMPPKRKATEEDYSKLTVAQLKALCKKRGLNAAGKKQALIDSLKKDDADAGGKKAKGEEKEDEKPTMKEKLVALAKAEEKSRKNRAREVDSHCSLAGAEVWIDFDCMLNQTNIGNNNNKFYVIQLLAVGKNFYVWNRWGRVGEPGANALKGPFNFETAEKEFCKKFKDKTRNEWCDRESFKPVAGKYTLIEMDTSNEEEKTAKLKALDAIDGVEKKVKPSLLIKPTQSLLSLLFDNDMFKEAMVKLNLDVKKMPLGKLSKMQIAKGFEVLEEMELLIDQGKHSGLEDLSSKFYTAIPHSFGRQRPPVINTREVLQKKMDMLAVLGDIEIAQRIKQEEEESQNVNAEEVDHPLDIQYDLLNTDLSLLTKQSDEFKFIEKYTHATGNSGFHKNMKILDVWRVNRHSEGERFSTHSELTNRRLLWHGTNIAVVVAILKSGLRIMPHSGGRVGRGIYFASENEKSSCYVGTSPKNIGIMFLVEVALGKEHGITKDNSSLKSPPKGFDSVVARGRTEPNPKDDIEREFDGNKVKIPQGKPITMDEYNNSSFQQSEYLVYKESQARIRYLLKIQF